MKEMVRTRWSGTPEGAVLEGAVLEGAEGKSRETHTGPLVRLMTPVAGRSTGRRHYGRNVLGESDEGGGGAELS